MVKYIIMSNLENDLIKMDINLIQKCDTEVLLSSYTEYKEECLNKLRGMFSFIVYDKSENKLFEQGIILV